MIQLKFKIEVAQESVSLRDQAREVLSQMDQEFNSMFNQRIQSKNFELADINDFDPENVADTIIEENLEDD